MNLSQKIQQFFAPIFGLLKKSRKAGVILFKNSVSELIEIQIENLICIQSKGSKSMVYYEEDSKIKSMLARRSLKSFQSEIEGQTSKIIRCHKSFIANLNKVTTISGSTKGFKLHHKGLDFKIPVSRRLGIDDLNQPDLFSS